MRAEPPVTFALLVLLVACGGESIHAGEGRRSAGGSAGSASASAGTSGAGGACTEPPSAVPTPPPYDPGVAPAQQQAFTLVLRNRCSRTVWPAWRKGGGLEYGVIDTALWLPIPSGSDHTVSGYSAVRDLIFWGRTGCSFDQQGNGACETGDCGSFTCSIGGGYPFPKATAYSLFGGFQDGYNVGMRVEGPTCGEHECVANVDGCASASGSDECGRALACSDACASSTTPCCEREDSECNDTGPLPRDEPGSGDLVVTFCP